MGRSGPFKEDDEEAEEEQEEEEDEEKEGDVVIVCKGSKSACNPCECDVCFQWLLQPMTDWLTTKWNGNFLLVKKKKKKKKYKKKNTKKY